MSAIASTRLSVPPKPAAIFEGEGGRAELETLAVKHRITQALLVEGRNRVRIHAPDHAIPPGFTATAPTLEDAYFVLQR